MLPPLVVDEAELGAGPPGEDAGCDAGSVRALCDGAAAGRPLSRLAGAGSTRRRAVLSVRVSFVLGWVTTAAGEGAGTAASGAMTPSDSATGVAAPGTGAAGAPNGEAIAVSATGAAVCRAAI